MTSMPDKFTAVWVSHSSISDFLKCPRAYYLNNVYKDPATGHKIQLMAPALALGGAVHEIVEALSKIPTVDRFKTPILEKFRTLWQRKYTGKQGGFSSPEQEQLYFQRGEEMLRRLIDHPGPLANKAVKIQGDLPQYWLSEEENIILCGKIDWLEYLPDQDAVHIIDFKTSKTEENGESLQLPIYHLLVKNTQHRHVAKASYWYLELNDEPTAKELPDLEEAHEQVLAVAKKMKLARKLDHFKCPHGDEGCYACLPLERIIKGEAEKVGVSEFRQDIYILPRPADTVSGEAIIL